MTVLDREYMLIKLSGSPQNSVVFGGEQKLSGSNHANRSKLLTLTKASRSDAFCLLFVISRFVPFHTQHSQIKDIFHYRIAHRKRCFRSSKVLELQISSFLNPIRTHTILQHAIDFFILYQLIFKSFDISASSENCASYNFLYAPPRAISCSCVPCSIILP